MKKISVVLLILAVAWGAFAEDAEGGWGEITGSAELSTTVDLYNGNTEAGNIGMWGKPGDAQLNVTWNWKKGDWSVVLPLRAHSNGYFGTAPHNKSNAAGDSDAKVIYNPDSPLTVTLPFSFKFDNTVGGLAPIAWTNANVEAVYTTDEYAFKAGFKNLLSNGSIALGAIGGWYKFAGGAAELDVSYNEAYATEWWRASNIVLGYGTPGDLAKIVNPKIKFWWEDIKGDNGVAFKYSVMDGALNFGIAFAGNAGKTMFGGTEPGKEVPTENSFLYDFLLQPTIGAGFKMDDFLNISFMVGFRTFKNAADELDYLGVPLHLGAKVAVMENLSIQADMSAYFVEDITLFNAGIRAVFGKPDAVDNFWARAEFAAYDLAGTFGNFGSPVIPLRINVGYNIKFNDDDDGARLVGKDADKLYGHLGFYMPDVASEFMEMYVVVRGGYAGYKLAEKLTVGIDARLKMTVGTLFEKYAEILDPTAKDPDNGLSTSWTTRYEQKTAMMFGFQIEPSIKWNLIENGSISATYTLGATDLTDSGLTKINGIDTNKVKIAFNWSF